MELVELNEGLGKYFGTDEGLLVVSAPESNALQLEDGDVIKSIDGREPKSVGHAMRILGSYQAGETLELSIMRDKRRKKLEIEMPADERTGKLYEFLGRPPAMPARAPQPPLPREIATKSEST
jgi:S1-C subfamily serine protease